MDTNTNAFRIVQSLTSENRTVASGRPGGLKGGAARAAVLSPERRKEIAERAIKLRWEKHRSKITD